MKRRIKRSTILLLIAAMIGTTVLLTACEDSICAVVSRSASENSAAVDSAEDNLSCIMEAGQSDNTYSLSDIAREQFLMDYEQPDATDDSKVCLSESSRHTSHTYMYENDNGDYYTFEFD